MWLAVSALAFSGTARGAEAVAPALQPVAHSALLTLEAAASPAGLTLRVSRTAAPQTPLAVTSLSVSVDGEALGAKARAEGLWSVALKDSRARAGAKLDVVVDHDGIREVLSGRIALPGRGGAAPGAVARLLGDHKQLAWWILNIAIVLIGAIAISRRLS